jgi:hypothetical protein
MRRQFLFVLAFALLSVASSFAQAPLIGLLPDKLGNWNATSRGFGTNPTADAKLLSEAGIVGSVARTYSNGTQVDLYRFRDPSGAYSVLTYLQLMPGSIRNEDLSPKDKEAMSSSPKKPPMYMEAFQVGNFVSVVYADQQEQLEATKRVVMDLIRKEADATPLPPIRTYLPEANRETSTERYALGPAGFQDATNALRRPEGVRLVEVAGFNSGAEAMFAKYKAGKDEATLLLIEYPTPQLAELHLRHLQRALSADKKSGSSVERKGSLLSIVLGPTSAAYTEKLRGAINYETEVTWNEPSTTATDPPITSTLVKIIIATMVLMGMAFVLGIAFGGVRVITKRLFPGKVFDRPAQMEVLQLGLSGKPIDPRDMY